MAAKKVSIINFKGGVGKTTLSLHLAAHLAARQKRVLVIDIDHQSSLSIVVLGQALWQRNVTSQNTINRVFQSFCNRKVPMPKDELIIKNVYGEKAAWAKAHYPTLDFVSAQFELDDTEIDLASTTYGNPTLSDWDKRTLLASWLDQVDAHNQYDYILFDCPPATKIVSQNALAASDCYIIPVIPDDLSSRGVTHFRSLVQNKIDTKLQYLRTTANIHNDDVPKNFVPKTNLAGIVPFLVKHAGRARSGLTNIHTEQIAALRRAWKGDVINSIGRNMIGVPESVNMGWPVWSVKGTNVTPAVKRMMTSICEELHGRIDK
ncbi:AAA family ATPase [uncultured Paludibaculum sp.]|uniref:ParA family protein n=1 Tax=uncultured Paludibaculum sp. TaxID=1765020 RepID=UPI002AAC4607|nr:AAA family ATPase [uncultured Paludibaculum sp.]